MLSLPPETATATCGCGSNGASAAMHAANSRFVMGSARSPTEAKGATSMLCSATGALLFAREPFLDWRRYGRKIALQARKGATGIGLLIEVRKRHAELQQIVGRLGALRVFLVALRESGGRVGVVLAYVEGLAKPVLRISSERILRPTLNKVAHRLLRRRIIGLS